MDHSSLASYKLRNRISGHGVTKCIVRKTSLLVGDFNMENNELAGNGFFS